MYGYKKEIEKPAPVIESDKIKAALLTTKTNDITSFVAEYNGKNQIKIDGSVAEPFIQEHLAKLENAKTLIEKGEDTEDVHELAIIQELVKEVK
jgi:hypothetical protein